MCHPKYRPLNGLPHQIGNQTETVSHGGIGPACPRLVWHFQLQNLPRHFFLIMLRSRKICSVSFLQQSRAIRISPLCPPRQDLRSPKGP